MDSEKLIHEVKLKAIRSSGSGGQNVNKVSTKIELLFDVINSVSLNTEQKELLQTNLVSKLTKEGCLILQCDETRSQLQNKKLVIQRFLAIIKTGLKKKKERKQTKVPKSVKLKRLDNKKHQSGKKASRKKPDLEA